MLKHFVDFYSPGTLVSEETRMPIDSWDVAKAVEMSKTIIERYDATPYGFQFITKERQDDELDSKTVASSPMYFLGGVIETYKQIKARNDPKDKILLANMQSNHWDKVIVNTNSWKIVLPFEPGDVILEIEDGK